MACFVVPVAEAIVTTVASRILRKKDQHREEIEAVHLSTQSLPMKEHKMPFYKKLNWLSNLLWGGSALLSFEHLWHGEVTPWFPFLTAASDKTDALGMLTEMSTVGVTMAAAVTTVWVGILAVSSMLEKRTHKSPVKSHVEG